MITINAALSLGKPGKLPVKIDSRTLDFSNYFDAIQVSNIPTELNWSIKKTSPWGMMNNWTLSDCTCAAAGHMIECWTANSNQENIITDEAVLAAFIALSGYDPVTGKNDNPVYLIDALKYWRKNGVGSHKIKAFATINYKNHDLVRAAVYLFGGVYVGLNLPKTIKGQEIWEVMPGEQTGDNTPGAFGGHAVNVVAYDETYITFISWGKIKKMTWGFWDTYCEELYAIISEDFFNENKTPIGLDMVALEISLLGFTKAHTNLEEIEGGNAGTAAGRGGTKGGSAGTSAASAGNKSGVEINEIYKSHIVAAGSAGGAVA